MIILKTFQGLENFYIKFRDFPYFSGSARTLYICNWKNEHSLQSSSLLQK